MVGNLAITQDSVGSCDDRGKKKNEKKKGRRRAKERGGITENHRIIEGEKISTDPACENGAPLRPADWWLWNARREQTQTAHARMEN